MDSTAYEILAALRLGGVPVVGLGEFAVGREAELAELDEQLDFVRQGKSAVKFVSGDYGSGKSFFCALVRERAFEKGFRAMHFTPPPFLGFSRARCCSESAKPGSLAALNA